MKSVVRRSGVFGVAAIWALVWALPAFVIEGLSNIGINFPITSLFDIWPMVLGIPGVIGGVAFRGGLFIANRQRSLEQWSPESVAIWGGLIGLLLGTLAFFNGVAYPEYRAVWPRATAIIGLTTVLGIAAALTSALVFRYAGEERLTAGA